MKSLFLILTLFSLQAHASEPWAASQPLSKLTGLNKPLSWQMMAPWRAEGDFAVPVSELPKFFSWKFYANGLTKIRKQVNSDCWAQGTTGVLENLVKITTNVEDLLSVQEIISCSGAGTANGGGYWGMGYQKSHGQSVDGDFPYTGRDIRCKSGLKPKYRVKAWGYVGGSGRSPKVTEVKQAMMQHGVLGTTISANSALSRHSGGGLFTGCSNGGTNHIEVLTAWNDSFEWNGKTYDNVFEVRNSWGESHGDKGYAWMKFGCSRVGTESVVWADMEQLQEDGSYRQLSPLEVLRNAGAI